MTTDLVDRLRDLAAAYPEDIFPEPPDEAKARDAAAAYVLRTVAVPWFTAAADRIEELEAENKGMRSIADDALNYISPYVYPDETDDERRNAYETLARIKDGGNR